MKLGDFLAPSRAIVPLSVATLAQARTALLERLSASGAVANPERLRERVDEERAEDMVAISGNAFLLHYRTDTAAALQIAIGVCPSAVRRTLEDGTDQTAAVVVVVVGPPRSAARQLQIVRTLGRLLANDELIGALLAAPSPEAVVNLPALRDHEIPKQVLVRDLMTEAPRTTTPDVPLRLAARELSRMRLGALPVVDEDQRLLGMLSERELMRHLLNSEVLSTGDGRHVSPALSIAKGKTVRDVMTRQVLCVAPEQPVAEVASLMANKDVERVPVVRGGRLVGFLTRGDIVRKLIGS